MKKEELHCKEICIYCLGEYGVALCYSLIESGCSVECFGDIDQRKSGYAILGINCIGYDAFCKLDKEKYIIAVAKKNPDKLIDDFKKLGFMEVYSDKELLHKLEMEGKNNNRFDKMDDLQEIYATLSCLKKINYQKYDLSKGNYKNELQLKKDIRQLLEDCFLRKQNERG